MMASSSNLSDHLLQDDLPWLSLPFAPSLHHTIGANHQWSQVSQPLMLNCSDRCTSNELEVLLSAQGHHHSQSAAPQSSSVLMMHELGFQWSNCAAADASMAMLVGQQDSHAIKAEEELRAESLNYNPRSSSCGTTTIAYSDTFDGAGLPLAALDGVVFPSVNVSRLQKACPAAPPLSGDAFEILASARLCKTLLSQASSVLHNGMPLLREQHVPYGPPAHLQGPSIGNYKMGGAPLVSGNKLRAAAQAAGRGGGGEKAAAAAVPSSEKLDQSRSSTIVVPSFKVKKEKLGDRIAALQQLVSPFGKTDTASVLMEAIGYIKFLQDQVETLSGPYMRSSKTKKARTAQQRGGENYKEERGAAANNCKRLDLRSRGLCLVPLSCTSYVTNENGVWAQPLNFGGN